MNYYFAFICYMSSVILSAASFSQTLIGAQVGLSSSKFYNYSSSENYQASYPLKSGISSSFFYTTKVDRSTEFTVALGYDFLNSEMEVQHSDGKNSFYRDLDFSLHQSTLACNYGFKFLNKERSSLAITTGPIFFFTLTSSTNGLVRDYVRNDMNTMVFREQLIVDGLHDFVDFRYGWTIGLEYTIQLNEKLNLHLSNTNAFNFSHVLKRYDLKYTSFLSSSLELGISFKIEE